MQRLSNRSIMEPGGRGQQRALGMCIVLAGIVAGYDVACRVALEFFDILDELLPDIQRVGGYFHVALKELAHRHSVIKEVRGFGLMLGVELAVPGKQVVLDAMAEGLLINCTHDTVLRFLPPYITSEKDVDQAVRIIGKLIAKLK